MYNMKISTLQLQQTFTAWLEALYLFTKQILSKPFTVPIHYPSHPTQVSTPIVPDLFHFWRQLGHQVANSPTSRQQHAMTAKMNQASK